MKPENLPDSNLSPGGNVSEREWVAEQSDLGKFLEIAAAHRLLSADEEKALAKRIERGDLAAKDTLILHNIRLVVHFMKPFQHQGLENIELVQEGIIGLIRAAEKFDYRQERKFSTYAGNWIKSSMQRALADKGHAIHIPSHKNAELQRIRKQERALAAKFSRQPTETEVAEAADVAESEATWLQQVFAPMTSLDALTGQDNDGSELVELIANEDSPDAEGGAVRSVLHEQVLRVVSEELDRQQREVIIGLYLDPESDRNRQRLAKRLRISEDELAQVETEAMATLSAAITGDSREDFVAFWDKHHPPRTRAEMKQQIKEWKEADPDRPYAEIAKRLGIGERKVCRLHHEVLQPDESVQGNLTLEKIAALPAVKSHIVHLNEQERTILAHRAGLIDGKQKSTHEISKQLRIPSSQVSAVGRSAIARVMLFERSDVMSNGHSPETVAETVSPEAAELYKVLLQYGRVEGNVIVSRSQDINRWYRHEHGKSPQDGPVLFEQLEQAKFVKLEHTTRNSTRIRLTLPV